MPELEGVSDSDQELLGEQIVRVSFFGSIQGIVGRKEDVILLPRGSASVGTVLEILSQRYKEFKELATYCDYSSLPVTIFVNWRCIVDKRELGNLLPDEAEVQILLATQMSGG